MVLLAVTDMVPVSCGGHPGGLPALPRFSPAYFGGRRAGFRIMS